MAILLDWEKLAKTYSRCKVRKENPGFVVVLWGKYAPNGGKDPKASFANPD
jgi:hypothetical protein